MGSLGYVSVYWTIDTLDWKPDRTPAEIRAAVLDKVRAGSIILILSAFTVFGTLISDILLALTDPRISFTEQKEAA